MVDPGPGKLKTDAALVLCHSSTGCKGLGHGSTKASTGKTALQKKVTHRPIIKGGSKAHHSHHKEAAMQTNNMKNVDGAFQV